MVVWFVVLSLLCGLGVRSGVGVGASGFDRCWLDLSVFRSSVCVSEFGLCFGPCRYWFAVWGSRAWSGGAFRSRLDLIAFEIGQFGRLTSRFVRLLRSCAPDLKITPPIGCAWNIN